MSDNKKFIQAQAFQLAGSGVSLSDTTIVLKKFKLPNSQAEITTSDLGGICYATLEAGSDREECISFTGVTQNTNGTATLTGVTRGLKFVAPYDQDLTLRKGHGGGTSLVITNGPGFYNEFASKLNNETIEEIWSFIQNPQKTTDVLAVNNRDFVTKNDLIAAALGTLAITGTVVSGTAGEAIALGKVCYLKASDNRWYKADAATPATFDALALGVAQSAPASAGTAMTVLPFGLDVNQSGLTPGAKIYLSDTAGNITHTPGTYSVFLGWAISATTALFVRNNDAQSPTAREKAAMAGTSGTAPSGSNKFVDNADTSATAAASKIVRANSNKKIDPAYIQNFAGDGSDGALTVTSGTTDIDLGGSQFVVKQYTSISITGTGKVTFSNPHASGTIIVLKSQGDVTLTSSQAPMLDFSRLGGAGGTGGGYTQVGSGTSGGSAGTSGTAGTNIQDLTSGHAGSSTATNSSAPSAGTQLTNAFLYSLSTWSLLKGINLACGSGGGGGQGANNQSVAQGTGGNGGRGGGVGIIMCNGAWNFTTANGISVSGKDGAAGQNVTSAENAASGGGGGGGSAGMFLALYNSLTANTGSITAAGGAGGAGGSATDTAGGSGGNAAMGAGGSGAGSLGGAGGAGGAGTTAFGTPGNSGAAAGGVGAGGGGGAGCGVNYNATTTVSGGSGGAAGGDAASTQTLITKNYYFA